MINKFNLGDKVIHNNQIKTIRAFRINPKTNTITYDLREKSVREKYDYINETELQPINNQNE